VSEFLMFALVGFVAQLVDSTLGMGFGIISASILLGQGYAPALVSASINAAKIPTSGTAAISHIYHGNVDPGLARLICIFGAIGGVLGVFLLTGLKGRALDYMVTGYLLAMGAFIVWRGLSSVAIPVTSTVSPQAVGFAGGLLEGIGGTWGPVVTPALLASGTEPRRAIGTSIMCEFLVSIVVFSAYLVALVSGVWHGDGWRDIVVPIAGLIVGGLPAAMFGGLLPRIAPQKPLTVAVGLLALGVGAFRLL